jgi:hypothetical protein
MDVSGGMYTIIPRKMLVAGYVTLDLCAPCKENDGMRKTGWRSKAAA